MTGENLLGVPETRLADEPEVAARIQDADGHHDTLGAIAADHPQSSLVWALLSDSAYVQGDRIASYAFARVGYHRGLDSLRKSGWKGQGPVPWSTSPTAASSAPSTRCVARPPPSARRTRSRASAPSCAMRIPRRPATSRR
ncbi:hypothetical protein BC477_00870 [Clavibacter michiganensis subsp. michiganensis]|uniref:DUF3151 domain-containing protein n=1 Tax=Clavibacter michiganensis subsp. michiganensis TaxID=33013 RepID=A0A251XF04_CLAMM|nr:hypothetical protein BC477_00870 [Clavibacter michiganensis subsp. michiganensis]OUE00872.1 hypothetical protein CMMCAS07_15650 [Clavibacter michiganensis subsp. michiganensis]